MTVKDKLEIGLKPEAPYRRANLPTSQQDEPACQDAAKPGHGAAVDRARDECDHPKPKTTRRP